MLKVIKKVVRSMKRYNLNVVHSAVAGVDLCVAAVVSRVRSNKEVSVRKSVG